MRISLTFRSIKQSVNNSIHDHSPVKTDQDKITDSQQFISNFLDELKTSQEIPHENSSESDSKHIDTLFISSSMFRNLREDKLHSREHSSKVLSYPGATAGEILKRLKSDPVLNNLDPKEIKKIYLLCGTNNVDCVLGTPKNLRNSIVDFRGFRGEIHEKSLAEFEHLTNFLTNWSQKASLNIINILPRTSYARNHVINNFNVFLQNLCVKNGHTFINTEINRNLFSTKDGFRKIDNFHVKGLDNVHLNNSGVIKLGKLLKYHMHL